MQKLFIILFLQMLGQLQAQEINGSVLRKSKNENKDISHIDFIIKDIIEEKWEKDEKLCVRETLNIMNNVKNATLWATWIWDSMSLPVGVLYGSRYHYGNYDQCVKVPWAQTHSHLRTQYCVLDITLSRGDLPDILSDPYSSVSKYIQSTTKQGMKFNKISWGVCMPANCQSKTVEKLARIVLRNSHFNYGIRDMNITTYDCINPGVSEPNNKSHRILIIYLISALITITCITVYNWMFPNKSDGFGSKIIEACCLSNNLARLSSTSANDLSVLHGIRAISSILVVVVHVWFSYIVVGVVNMKDLETDSEKFLQPLAYCHILVDTYLMMSGLLLVKSFMKIGKIDPLKFIVIRYLRLVWPSILIVMTAAKLEITDDPRFLRIVRPERQFCEKNWLINLLMLGNYVDTENVCYPSMWTIPVDFHLSVVTTILYCIFHKRRHLGVTTFSILLAASLIMPGIVNYQKGLPLVTFVDVGFITNYRKNLFQNPTYISSHLRAGPYLVGAAAGYFMSIFKPINHRNYISKNWSLVGSILSIFIAMTVMVMASTVSASNNAILIAMYNSLSRSVWAVMMALLVIFCEYGDVAVIGNILKWRAFVPLSKLSFNVYLFHLSFLLYLCSRSNIRHDWLLTMNFTSGIIGVSFIVSFFIYLFFEAPFHNIIRVLLETRSTSAMHSQNEEKARGINTGFLMDLTKQNLNEDEISEKDTYDKKDL